MQAQASSESLPVVLAGLQPTDFALALDRLEAAEADSYDVGAVVRAGRDDREPVISFVRLSLHAERPEEAEPLWQVIVLVGDLVNVIVDRRRDLEDYDVPVIYVPADQAVAVEEALPSEFEGELGEDLLNLPFLAQAAIKFGPSGLQV
jgi:hypothetical protein